MSTTASTAPVESRDTASTREATVSSTMVVPAPPSPSVPRGNLPPPSPRASHHHHQQQHRHSLTSGSPVSVGSPSHPKRHTMASISMSPNQHFLSGSSIPTMHSKHTSISLLGNRPLPGLPSHGSPLLAPQTPPPSLRNLAARPLSLSPTRRHSNYETQRAAIEAACQSERARAKQMESNEVECTADELRFILKKERLRMTKQAGDIARLKQAAVQCQVEAEINEEGRINGLMRHMDGIQLEKSRVVSELEKEEELLASTLKKLEEVRKEKKQLLDLIKHEESHHSNLQSKLEGIQNGEKQEETDDGNDTAATTAPPDPPTEAPSPSADISSPKQQRRSATLPHMESLEEDPYAEEQEDDDSNCGEKVDLPDLANISG